MSFEEPSIVQEGYIYPIKSCAGSKFGAGQTYPIDVQGSPFDRQWLVTDEKGEFRTQRHDGFEKLALVRPQLNFQDRQLVLNAPGMETMSVPLGFDKDSRIHQEVDVWGDRCNGMIEGEATLWMREYLHQQCMLVRKAGQRLINRPTAPSDAQISFADRYHLLGISEETLEELNRLLPNEVLMNRFRPNLVFRGGLSHQENGWKHIRVGEAELKGVKPCERCRMTDVNQETAERGKVVLKTLNKHFRGHQNQPIFGENFIVHRPGSIKIGDHVQVLDRHQKTWDREY